MCIAHWKESCYILCILLYQLLVLTFCIRHLGKIAPLENLYHVKRVRKRAVEGGMLHVIGIELIRCMQLICYRDSKFLITSHLLVCIVLFYFSLKFLSLRTSLDIVGDDVII